MVRHRKKGIVEIILVMVLLLAFAFSLLIAKTLNNTFVSSNVVNTTYLGYSSDALGVFNEGYIIIIVGAIIALAIGAVIVYAHPVFAIPYMVVMIFVVMLAAVFSNIFGEFASQPQMTQAAGSFPLINQAYLHWPLIILVGCVIIIIAYFGKGGGQP
jgi:hypothetical protein